jgi:hypothetical protein
MWNASSMAASTYECNDALLITDDSVLSVGTSCTEKHSRPTRVTDEALLRVARTRGADGDHWCH